MPDTRAGGFRFGGLVKGNQTMKYIGSFSVQVKAELDSDAGVWVATSPDVPGLVAEHVHLEKLFDMVLELVPLLLVENDALPQFRDLEEAYEVPVHIAAHGLAKRSALIPA